MMRGAMMTRRLLLGTLVGALAACSSDSGGSAPDGPISYRSSGGFTGGGDGTPQTTVELDGLATRAKPGGGTESAMLDMARLDDLRDKVADAQFPALAPMYSCACADDFKHHVTVQLEGKAYEVQVDYSATAPEPLMVVIGALRDISQAPLDWR